MWLKPFIKSVLLLTVLRTLFYQFLILFAGLSLGFIINSEYIGYKSHILSKSLNNVFSPVRFDETVLKNLKNWGAFKLWAEHEYAEDFKIIEDAMMAEEWYWAKFSYKNKQNKTVIDIQSTRIRWKTWEQYYDLEMPTEEDLKDYIKNGTLNSNETEKAFKLRNEKMAMERDKIKT